MSQPEKTTQFSKALLELRSLILNGSLEPGERLAETVLSERLGFSRTPLRAAMAQLVQEGLLERASSGRCSVCSLTMDDILDAIELRGVIEGTAARLAAERGADADSLRACKETLAALDTVFTDTDEIDFERYVDLNATFHEQVSRLAGSAVIEREVKRASSLPLASPSAFLQGQEDVEAFRKSLRGAQQQHKIILAAIEAREGGRAESMAREHARLARRNLEYAMYRDRSLKDRIPGLSLVSAD